MQILMVTLSGVLEVYVVLTNYYADYGGHWMVVTAVLLFGLAFLLNRRGYLISSTWITILVLALSILVMTFYTYGLPVDLGFLYYLFLPLLFASLFFSDRTILFLTVLFILGVFVPSVFFFHFPVVDVVIGPVFFVLLSGVLTVVVVRNRNQQEDHRRQVLIENEERYRTLLETSYEGVCILSGDIIRDANPGFARLFGYELAELLGKSVMSLFPPAARSDMDVITLGNGSHPSDRPVRRKDGSSLYIETISRNQTYRGRPATVIAVRDVTDRTLAEQELDQREHLYRSLFENANDAIFLMDLENVFIAGNQKAADLLGYTVEELIGRSLQDVVLPFDYPDSIRVRESLLATEPVPLYERLLLKKDGSNVPVEINATLIRDLKGDPLYIQGIVRDITDRRRTEQQVQQHLERLKALREIDQMISSSTDLQVTLDAFLNYVISLLGPAAADVLLIDPNFFHLDYSASRGINLGPAYREAIRLDEKLAGRAVLERKLIAIDDLQTAGRDNPRLALLVALGFRTGYAVPLISKGIVKGVLEVFKREKFEATADWTDFLETLGGQAAIAIDSAGLFQSLQRTNFDLIRSYDATLEGWARALELHNKDNEGQTQRTTELALELGRLMRMNDTELIHLRRGALLHDIGMMAIPDEILFKPEPLDEKDWELVKQHPIFARQMLAPIQFLRRALDVPYFHHERWDGSGYPLGLQSESIPLAARVFAVVDVWDALQSDRPFRPAWPREKALQYIQANAGVLFDPQVVAAFMEIVGRGE